MMTVGRVLERDMEGILVVEFLRMERRWEAVVMVEDRAEAGW